MTARQQLATLIERRAAHLGREFAEVATIGDVSPKTLFDVRDRNSAKNFRPKTLRGIERGLDWPRGTIDMILTTDGTSDLDYLVTLGSGQPSMPVPAENPELTAIWRQIHNRHDQDTADGWLRYTLDLLEGHTPSPRDANGKTA